MSESKVPERVKIRLWGKAAGRCEYPGCNKALWRDDVTKVEFNSAYVAHIISDRPDGPRGNQIDSPRLKTELSNLMLLCDAHHRLIDKQEVDAHSVELLRAMKQSHEERMERLTAIDAQRASHIVLYSSDIDSHNGQVSFESARAAMVPDRYPASDLPVKLGMANTTLKDGEEGYWREQAAHLQKAITARLTPLVADGALQHVSIFAKAPQPLLILLGTLCRDLVGADVYQLHREPSPGWVWPATSPDVTFNVKKPSSHDNEPCIVFSLSATVAEERIHRVLGHAIDIWHISIPTPSNDFLKSRHHVAQFRELMRALLDEIKTCHGHWSKLHVFPAMPIALAIELGRVYMPKADLPLIIYDENRTLGGFIRTLSIPQ